MAFLLLALYTGTGSALLALKAALMVPVGCGQPGTPWIQAALVTLVSQLWAEDMLCTCALVGLIAWCEKSVADVRTETGLVPSDVKVLHQADSRRPANTYK